MNLSEFSPKVVTLDVRSPGEYKKGHIPGAINVPLFDDDERAKVGTTYNRAGRYEAIKNGVKLIGPKLSKFFPVLESRKLKPGDRVFVYCWRGGMRSGSVAWLLSLCGYQVTKLDGGYRSYRRWCRKKVGEKDSPVPAKIIVLGGSTGSGKTAILEQLRAAGQQVLDLEDLANHRGSAFGWIGQATQPSNEWYENMIAASVRRVDPNAPLWIEHEGQHVGTCSVPLGVQHWIKTTPGGGGMVVLNLTQEVRAVRLVEDYCSEDDVRKEGWMDNMKKCISLRKGGLAKKLGGARVKEALEALDAGKFSHVAKMMLQYYDKLYKTWVDHSDSDRILPLACPTGDAKENARLVTDFYHQSCLSREAPGDSTVVADTVKKAKINEDPPAEEAPRLEGTCHCGEVRVIACGKPRSVSYCHCSICRKLSGAPFNCQALYVSKQVRVELAPGGKLTGMKTSRGVERQRCFTCLSPVKATLFGGKLTAVPLQLLCRWTETADGPTNNIPEDMKQFFLPKHHMYYKHRVMDVDDDLPKYTGAVRVSGSKPKDVGKHLVKENGGSVKLMGDLVKPASGDKGPKGSKRKL